MATTKLNRPPLPVSWMLPFVAPLLEVEEFVWVGLVLVVLEAGLVAVPDLVPDAGRAKIISMYTGMKDEMPGMNDMRHGKDGWPFGDKPDTHQCHILLNGVKKQLLGLLKCISPQDIPQLLLGSQDLSRCMQCPFYLLLK
jgi:hypothetical protein